MSLRRDAVVSGVGGLVATRNMLWLGSLLPFIEIGIRLYVSLPCVSDSGLVQVRIKKDPIVKVKR